MPDLEQPCGSATDCLFRNIPPEQARQVIKEIAAEGGKEGARDLLFQIGLGGTNAAEDILAIRTFMHNFKNARIAARNGFISFARKAWNIVSGIVLTIVIYHGLVKMGFDPKTLSAAIKGD